MYTLVCRFDKKTMAINKDLITWTEINRIRGHSPTAGRIRKNNIETLSEGDRQAVEALLNYQDDWAKKYTKIK